LRISSVPALQMPPPRSGSSPANVSEIHPCLMVMS
jgi:hypothetical protein